MIFSSPLRFAGVIISILLAYTAVMQNSEAMESKLLPAQRLAQFSTTEQAPNLAKTESIIISQTNRFRQEQGRQPVSKNSHLAAAAEYFAHFMARTNKYGHTADGQQPAERASHHGYNYCIVEENIAYQYSSAGFTTKQLADRFVKGWEHSPGHRKNMLNPQVVDVGVAVTHSKESGVYFAVQMFGRPKSKSIQFAVSNQTNAEIKYTLTETDKTFSLAPRFTRIHRQCKPAQVRFAALAQDRLYRARQGMHFIVSKNKAGTLHIQQQPLQIKKQIQPAEPQPHP